MHHIEYCLTEDAGRAMMGGGERVFRSATWAHEIMKKSELKEFRTKLLELRARMTGDVASLSDEAFRSRGEDGTKAGDPEEMGSDSQDQEITFQMLQSEGNVLAEIDEAIRRIENGTYGKCRSCGGDIGKNRLEAVPHATQCIKCKNYEEKKQRGL